MPSYPIRRLPAVRGLQHPAAQESQSAVGQIIAPPMAPGERLHSHGLTRGDIIAAYERQGHAAAQPDVALELGVSVSTLFRAMKDLDLSWPPTRWAAAKAAVDRRFARFDGSSVKSDRPRTLH
jgi:hypothetical protein